VSTDVLVVEDEPDIRSSEADILRQAGYEVEEAADGVEALALLATRRVGAVLLDIRMPRCNGVAVVDALVDPPPIVVVSAHQLEESDLARMGHKVVAVLKKPVPPAQLLDRVAAALKPVDGPVPWAEDR
jgi:two-component system, OmpR family, response regulator PrrA